MKVPEEIHLKVVFYNSWYWIVYPNDRASAGRDLTADPFAPMFAPNPLSRLSRKQTWFLL